MTEDDLNHKSAYEDNFLMSYQGLHPDSNDGNRDVSLKQVNYLRISVLKSYRKTLRDTQRQAKPPIENLRELTNMPVDIFFEILEYLHPIDLLHLKNSCGAFRALLSGPSTESFWKAAFVNHPDIPEVPSDISCSFWAELLFGALKCQVCGVNRAALNITFRQHLCYDCHYSLFKMSSKLEPRDGEPDVRHLIKPAMILVVDPFDANAENTRWVEYNIAEALEISRTFLSLKDDTDNGGLDGAKRMLDEWETERISIVSAVLSAAQKCLSWGVGHQRSYRSDIHNKTYPIAARLKPRLKALNTYPDVDVDASDFTEVVLDLVARTGAKRLSKRGFVKLLPFLEPIIQKTTDARLKEERESLITARTEFTKAAYNKYKATCLPSTWSYMPPLFVVKDFGPISEAINALHDDPLKDEDLEGPFECLPSLIDEWRVSKFKQLAAQLPSQKSSRVDEEERDPDVLALDLATSVFNCLGSSRSSLRTGGCLIGWDGTGPHLRCPALEKYWENRLHFSQRGYDAATELVTLAGFDACTAKIWDMDALNPRFVCLTCPLEANSRIQDGRGRSVWNWREAVYHYMKPSAAETHPSPVWGILAPEAEADIKAREGSDPYVGDARWGCNHCPVHFNACVVRRSAISHVSEVHDITNPIENLDYLFHPGGVRTIPKPLVLPEEQPRDSSCLHCAPTKRRLFSATKIKLHLKDAHQQREPAEGRDYSKVCVILRRTVVQETIPIVPDTTVYIA